MKPGWGSVPRPLPRSPPRARGWAQGSGVGAGVMLITALGRQVCPSPGLPVERDKGFCPLPSSRFCPPPHPVPPVPPPVGAAFLPPRAAAAPGRVSPPAPPRAAPSRPRRAAEGGGGAGSWGRKEDKKGGKKTNTHPPKKPSPAAAGTPPSPPVLGPVRLRRVGEPTLRVAGCTRGAVQRHTWTIRTVHTQTRTHVRTHIDTRGDTRAHGETRPRVGLGGGVPTAPSKSLRIPSRCSFTESRAMGEEGGGTRGRPAWEPQSGAEPERSSGTGRDGGGCPGLCGRGAGGGGGGGERAGGGGEGCRGRGRRGEVLPAPRPGRIPPYPYPTGVASPGGSGGSRPLRPPSRCCGSFPPESRG